MDDVTKLNSAVDFAARALENAVCGKSPGIFPPVALHVDHCHHVIPDYTRTSASASGR